MSTPAFPVSYESELAMKSTYTLMSERDFPNDSNENVNGHDIAEILLKIALNTNNSMLNL